MKTNEVTFEVTHDHIKLLRALNVSWCYDEFGAPAIDPKRPYGSSDVVGSLIETLDLPYADTGVIPDNVYSKVRKLHDELDTVLEIVLQTGSFEPGVYRRACPYVGRWQRVGA